MVCGSLLPFHASGLATGKSERRLRFGSWNEDFVRFLPWLLSGLPEAEGRRSELEAEVLGWCEGVCSRALVLVEEEKELSPSESSGRSPDFSRYRVGDGAGQKSSRRFRAEKRVRELS